MDCACEEDTLLPMNRKKYGSTAPGSADTLFSLNVVQTKEVVKALVTTRADPLLQVNAVRKRDCAPSR